MLKPREQNKPELELSLICRLITEGALPVGSDHLSRCPTCLHVGRTQRAQNHEFSDSSSVDPLIRHVETVLQEFGKAMMCRESLTEEWGINKQGDVLLMNKVINNNFKLKGCTAGPNILYSQ